MATTPRTCDMTVALRVTVPTLPDGTTPAPDEMREMILSFLRHSGIGGMHVVDAAPLKRDLRSDK